MDSSESLQKALDFLNPSDLSYTEWVQVGMALKAEGFTAEAWENWSARDAGRYHYGECTEKWKSFVSDGISGGTVVKMALDRGMPKSGRRESRALSWDDVIGGEAVPGPEPGPDRNPAQELVTYLRTLFEPEEYVGYCTEVFTQDDRKVPGKGAYTRTAGELIALLEKTGSVSEALGSLDPEAGAWIRFNPLDGKGVKNENVTRLDYALVECDNLEIPEQLRLIRKLRLPVATLVHSGKKSVHAVVRVNAKNYGEYRERVRKLYAECAKAGLTVDEQNKNPSRLSRMPGVDRNGSPQYLISTNTGTADFDAWCAYLSTEADTLPEFINLANYLTEQVPMAPELVSGILRQGHKAIITGPSKAGKSFLLIELAIAIAAGGYWLETFPCKPGKVLYCNFEIDGNSFINRAKNVLYHMQYSVGNNFQVWNLRGCPLQMSGFSGQLIRRIKTEHFAAVIIDPIYKLNPGDENAAGDMTKFLNALDTVCSETGASVIFAHHHAKGDMTQRSVIDRGSGSGVLARDPDAIMDLSELELTDETVEAHRKELLNRHIRLWMRRNLSAADDAEPDWESHSPEENLSYAVETAEEQGLPYDDLERACETLSGQEIKGFRMDFVLREFASPKPMNLWFDYPLHYADSRDTLKRAAVTSPLRSGNKAWREKNDTNAKQAFYGAIDATDGRPESVSAFLGKSKRRVYAYTKKYNCHVENGVIVKDENISCDGTATDNLPDEGAQ